MTVRRVTLLVTSLSVVLALVAGTGGFSTAAAERGVQVAVADDDAAYLGFDQRAVTTNGTTNLSVTLTNRFHRGVTLTTVEVTADGETRTLAPLEAGESQTATFESVDCDGPVSVKADGGSVSVRLDREACG